MSQNFGHGFPAASPGMRIGLLGGSFDPAHEGHVHVTEQALKRFGLDRVWWLVSPGNPLKQHGPAPLAERMAVARRVMDDPRVIVTDLESRMGTRLTIDTIRRLQAAYPGVRFVWLMGADNLVQFAQWDHWREIAARVPIGVLARPGSRLPGRLSKAAQVLRRWRLPESAASRLAMAPPPAWVMINIPMSSLSSSAIRAQRRRQGRAE